MLAPRWLHVGKAVSPTEKELFVLPLVGQGPNNQIGQLKHTMALARMLGRTVLLPPIFDHYLGDPNESLMLEDIFDRGSLEKAVGLRTVQEARGGVTAAVMTTGGGGRRSGYHRRGLDDGPTARKGSGGGESPWNGIVDAHLMRLEPGRTTVSRSYAKEIAKMERTLNISIAAAKKATVKWCLDICNEKGIQELTKRLADFRVIMVYPAVINQERTADGQMDISVLSKPSSFGSLVGTAGSHRAPSDICHEAHMEVDMALRMSDKLRSFAKESVRDLFGARPFVAAHVRPYPDSCLDAWASHTGDLAEAGCKTDDLLVDLPNKVRWVLERHNLSQLLILAHPKIRWRIDQLLAPLKTPLTVRYVEPQLPAFKRLEKALGSSPDSASTLLYAEQAVAVMAEAFIGTRHSSATWTVVDQRAAERKEGLPDPGAAAEEEGEGGGQEVHETDTGINGRVYFFGQGTVNKQLVAKARGIFKGHDG